MTDDERLPRRSRHRQTIALALLAACVATALPAQAQPAADQLVPKYGNDATPYPLYAGTFGARIRWTDADLERIANHFDAFYGVPRFTREQVDTLRRIKPTFQVLNYEGNWQIRDHATYERQHRSGMLHYRVGTLRQPLSAADTTVHLDDMLGGLRASTADPDRASSGDDDGGFRQVTWLRIGDEYLRITAVDGASATVVRGFDGSAPAAHAPGAAVLAPVLGEPPAAETPVRYRHDPLAPLRWDELDAAIEEDFTSHGGGIWIDIVTGDLSIFTLTGEPVPMNRRWNVRTGRGYTPAEWDEAAETGVRRIMDAFCRRHGTPPVIWGNNLMHPTSLDHAAPGRLGLLLSTAAKPRPLDGFAQENCYGGYDSGTRAFTWADAEAWRRTLQSIMFMGELGVSARPLLLDGGTHNSDFAAEPESFRHQVLLFGYGSYLLAVKVEDDDRVSTMLGFTPVVGPNSPGERRLELPPWFTYDIGRPAETHASADADRYRLPGKSTYARRFERGLVLVNPADAGEDVVDLDRRYWDPLAEQTVTRITLPHKTARILLHDAPPAARPAVADRRPNLVVVLADDLGYGEVGCFGQQVIKTPHLDRMAREGLRFTQFYSGAAVCAPSRSVLMTGLHQGRTRVRGNTNDPTKNALRAGDVTVAKVLHDAGYRTAVFGKWGLGDVGTAETGLPKRQGFDHFFGFLNHHHAHNHYPDYLWRNDDRIALPNRVRPVGGHGSGVAEDPVLYADDLVTEEMLSWISRNQAAPFFVYWAPILPHANNEKMRELEDGSEVPDYGEYTTADWSDQDKGHAAMITRLDGYVGRLLDHLERLGLADDTIVLFSSDNGAHAESGQTQARFNPAGPLRGGKRSLAEGGIRMPTIAWGPSRVPALATSDHPGHFADWLATAAELAGATVPDGLTSVSFAPALLGRPGQQKAEFLYWEHNEGGFRQAALWHGRWKAMRTIEPQPGFELYDLQADLAETTDVAAAHPEIVARFNQFFDTARTDDPAWPARTRGRD